MELLTQSKTTTDKFTSPEVVTLLGMTLIGLLSRMWGIGGWSAFGDEVYTITFAEERMTGTNPAYYFLVYWSQRLLGDTVWAARLPSAILGTLSIPVFYLACRDFFNKPVAMVSTILLLLHGWHLYHSQLSRFYAGVFLFSILSFFLYYKSIEKGSISLLMAALVSNGLLVLFHATAIVAPAACLLFSIVGLAKKSLGFSRRVLWVHVGTCLALGLVLASLLIGAIQGRAILNETGLTFSFSEPIGGLLQLILKVEFQLILAAGFGFIHYARSTPNKPLFLFVCLGVCISGFVVMGVLLPPIRAKYVISILPLVIALPAGYICIVGAEALKDRSSLFTRHIIAGLLIISLLPSFISNYTGKSSLDIRDAKSYLDQVVQEDDYIVVFSTTTAYSLAEEFPPNRIVLFINSMFSIEDLERLDTNSGKKWILMITNRNTSYTSPLYVWLLEHTSLVWRKYDKRYDYPILGFEIYLYDPLVKNDVGSDK